MWLLSTGSCPCSKERLALSRPARSLLASELSSRPGLRTGEQYASLDCRGPVVKQQIRFCTTSDGVRIAYATTGNGPPVIRVLGWFMHLEFDCDAHAHGPLIEAISADFTYVRYDGRGMGLSDRGVTDFSLDAKVRDLEAVIDALGVEKLTLFAWSEGGATAVTYAARHPERVSNLILYGSFPRMPMPDELVATWLPMIRHGWGRDLPAHRQFFTGLFFPDATTDTIRVFNAMQRAAANAEEVAAMLTELTRVDVTELLPKVAVPTLVIHLRGDAVVPFELGRELAAGIPGARFLPLDGRNHGLPPNEPAREAIQRGIAEFLGARDSAAVEAPAAVTGAPLTILFTDVEGSASLTQCLGDAKARELLRVHERIVRQALKAHDGAEVKSMGDGFMTSFPSAKRAVECAIAMQRALGAENRGAEQSIKVRIGLNAGEPIAEDTDLFGTAVIVASRIAAKAAGGEILVSDLVRGLVAGKGFQLSDKGEAVLRGFDEPVRLYSVRWDEGA